jgi:hypothetical protein
MKKVFIITLLLMATAMARPRIVRVYVPSINDLSRISAKLDLDIIGVQAGVSFDLLADDRMMDRIIGSGLSYEVVVHDLASAKEGVRADYLSYSDIEDSLRQLAQDYPAICKFDSLPIPILKKMMNRASL